MLVNKKLGRLKQWAGERMGGEVKTGTTDDFKALEQEMVLRHEGMEKLHRTMAAYVKSISRKNEGNDRDKSSPVGYLGTTMISHGEDFEHDSEFGTCLISFGRANERIGRIQESYAAQATTTWLDTLERSLVQMKEYQASRKKLENRRLAYDTSLAKMEKAKREDFRVEEELRSQKAKYEESSEDVQRRMEDIKEAELDSVAGLSAFLEEELAYHSRCREILLQLNKDWPATSQISEDRFHRRANRSRSNTTHSQSDRLGTLQDEYVRESKAAIRTTRIASNPSSGPPSPTRDTSAQQFKPNRSVTWRDGDQDLPDRSTRNVSPPSRTRFGQTATDIDAVQATRFQLRPVKKIDASNDVFGDDYDSSVDRSSSPERSATDASASPATSYGSVPSRLAWSSANSHTSNASKKAPPPPPPSRSKKPPPPPMKRSALSSSAIPLA